jgi:hypothetical protein
MLRWSLSAKRAGPLGLLVKCELLGEPNTVPRTRRMIFESGAATEEELFYQNAETKRIYYRKSDTFGTIGYVASSYIDQIDNSRCRLHILSWFDSELDASVAADRFESIYKGIFDGFKAYLSTDASVSS